MENRLKFFLDFRILMFEHLSVFTMFKKYFFSNILLLLMFSTPAIAVESKVAGRVTIDGQPVANAVVYLLRSDGEPIPDKPMEITIKQEDTKFDPSFSVVTTGSTIRFENLDDNIHNVNSQTPANRFDVGSHLPGTIKKVVLKKNGIVLLRCKVHHEMRGKIYVSPSSYFAVTDEAGRFNIDAPVFPAYKIHTWHPSLTEKEIKKGAKQLNPWTRVENFLIAFESPVGSDKDLTEINKQDWIKVIQEIDTALNSAYMRWEKKKATSAAIRVMTTQSKLFNESGLRNAISNAQGEQRALDFEDRFDQIRKWVQGLGKKTVTASQLKQNIDLLVKDLMKDAKILKGL